MILKYRFGKPIDTGAVVKNCAVDNKIPDIVTFSSDRTEIRYHMQPSDVVYGLGEQVRGINKRGWIYESNCSDDADHTEGKHSLYAAHNFLLIDGRQKFGIFLDTPGKVRFDIGYTQSEELSIVLAEADYDCYLLSGTSLAEIVREFRTLIGRSYIPPKWAFGFGQSRWSYMNEDAVREVADQYRAMNIPLDSIYLDIDYMEHYKDFTINGKTFPDFSKFVQEMKTRNIHLVPIIDAGVKIENGYSVYEEGIAEGYFCKDAEGKDFVAAAWPGRVHFPDFLNTRARHWFGRLYKGLLDDGIEGFWNDMNEPAIFYSEDGLRKMIGKVEAAKDTELDYTRFFDITDAAKNVSNSAADYASFYHDMDGRKIRHDKVHNLYGYNMTKAAGEAFEDLRPDRRILMFSRSSYIGMHRYGGIWTGDNKAWWSHLELSIKQMPSLNMCGFLFTGSDIGGFGDDCTVDLMLRWLEFGIFTPLMRSHSAEGTRLQELTAFHEMSGAFSAIVSLRYMLMPYLYSEYMKSALKDEMYFRPLAFDFPQDKRARTVEDQLLVGECIMIAPVYQQNAEGRYVYLPEDMKLYRFRGPKDFDTEVVKEGEHYISCHLNEVLIFIRKNRIVPVSEGGQYIDDIDESNLRLLGYLCGDAEYSLYNDDGVSRNYDMSTSVNVIHVKQDGSITTAKPGWTSGAHERFTLLL